MLKNNDTHPVLLFDGVCNLCNASVQWVLLRDPQGIFRYASLQSDYGQAVLQQHGLPVDALNTVVLVDGERIFTHSDVPLQVLYRLGGGWRLLSYLRVVPRFLRDGIYNWVARNRYRWFGRRAECMLPRKEWKDRFISEA